MNTFTDSALRMGRLPDVYADPAMLRQVWVNLIGNAVKYTRPRTRVEIKIGCTADGEEDVCCRSKRPEK